MTYYSPWDLENMTDGTDASDGLDGSDRTPIPTVGIDGTDTQDGLDGSVERVTGTVLDQVREHLGRYLSPASSDDLDLLALWAVHTHLAAESYTTGTAEGSVDFTTG